MFHYLYGLFNKAMGQPQFYFMCVFFLLATAFTEKLLYWSNIHMTEKKEEKQETHMMLLQYKRAHNSGMMKKRGARSATVAAQGGDAA